ncbi:hypothetical protein AMAG_16484 [Allomyces macrogynus ATCC 38327]|uniref:Uncharacterized protein n=1 Tax=Allomyces macrogynus (strain ATCC 38327) TaxID=578462 RepID=A0A0L0TD33_ALLM3|nr:hypothetical protein AMAG_16484 [Allomyces macrogynus ATCC 38327]|eukprot:KNE72439.1 hypothetical protein AMAG_16484 [Allomyces macrogynus ATCC 38327]
MSAPPPPPLGSPPSPPPSRSVASTSSPPPPIPSSKPASASAISTAYDALSPATPDLFADTDARAAGPFFGRLPNEITAAIAAHVGAPSSNHVDTARHAPWNVRDVYRLAVTCRRVHRRAMPLVWRTLLLVHHARLALPSCLATPDGQVAVATKRRALCAIDASATKCLVVRGPFPAAGVSSAPSSPRPVRIMTPMSPPLPPAVTVPLSQLVVNLAAELPNLTELHIGAHLPSTLLRDLLALHPPLNTHLRVLYCSPRTLAALDAGTSLLALRALCVPQRTDGVADDAPITSLPDMPECKSLVLSAHLASAHVLHQLVTLATHLTTLDVVPTNDVRQLIPGIPPPSTAPSLRSLTVSSVLWDHLFRTTVFPTITTLAIVDRPHPTRAPIQPFAVPAAMHSYTHLRDLAVDCIDERHLRLLGTLPHLASLRCFNSAAAAPIRETDLAQHLFPALQVVQADARLINVLQHLTLPSITSVNVMPALDARTSVIDRLGWTSLETLILDFTCGAADVRRLGSLPNLTTLDATGTVHLPMRVVLPALTALTVSPAALRGVESFVAPKVADLHVEGTGVWPRWFHSLDPVRVSVDAGVTVHARVLHALSRLRRLVACDLAANSIPSTAPRLVADADDPPRWIRSAVHHHSHAFIAAAHALGAVPASVCAVYVDVEEDDVENVQAAVAELVPVLVNGAAKDVEVVVQVPNGRVGRDARMAVECSVAVGGGVRVFVVGDGGEDAMDVAT